MDAFAVAVATSVLLRRVSGRQVFRLAWHFGLFQAMMPLIGWFAGRSVVTLVSAYDHWVAFAILSIIGARAIHSAFSGEDPAQRGDPTRGLSLIVLSIATSIDALAVGLSFAMLNVRIWYPAAVIGLVAMTMTTLGMLWGSRLGEKFGRGVEILGGVVLIGMGLHILISHLTE